MPVPHRPDVARPPLRASLLALAAALFLGACGTVMAPGDVAQSSASQDAGAERMMRLAEEARARGDHGSALTFYRRAHQTRPERIEPLVGLGTVLTDMNSAREALEAWRLALARDATNADALRGYGRALLALGQPEEAARQYEAVLAARPDDIKALNGLAVARDMTGDHGGAQERYRAAMALAPDDANLRNNYGFSLILARNLDEAIRVLEPLARNPAATAQQRQNLALAYGLAGREEEAARVARLDLEEPAVRQNLAYYREARAQARGQGRM